MYPRSPLNCSFTRSQSRVGGWNGKLILLLVLQAPSKVLWGTSSRSKTAEQEVVPAGGCDGGRASQQAKGESSGPQLEKMSPVPSHRSHILGTSPWRNTKPLRAQCSVSVGDSPLASLIHIRSWDFPRVSSVRQGTLTWCLVIASLPHSSALLCKLHLIQTSVPWCVDSFLIQKSVLKSQWILTHSFQWYWGSPGNRRQTSHLHHRTMPWCSPWYPSLSYTGSYTFLNWKTIVLQCCGFCCATMWISHN